MERWIPLTSHLILDICSPFRHSQHVHLLYSAVFFKDDIQFLYCERALTCSAEKKYILKLRLNLPLRSPFKILPRERAAMSSCNAHWAMSIYGILWNTGSFFKLKYHVFYWLRLICVAFDQCLNSVNGQSVFFAKYEKMKNIFQLII